MHLANRTSFYGQVALGVLALVATAGCGSSSSPSPTAPTAVVPTPPAAASGGGTSASPPPSTPEVPAPAPRPPADLIAVGDIGMCGYREVAETATLVDSLPGTIALLGDIAYMDGTERNFMECFDPWWGRHKHRSRPVPGNHEYSSAAPTAAPYFAYFGANAGPPGLGYYTYEAGEWLMIALNSNVPIGEGSAQFQWLRTQLAGDKHKCAAAYWHHPRFSSGRSGNNSWMGPVWRLLDEAGVDLVLSGHDHSYERFAPQDADGHYHPQGVRQFVVGTGGAYLYEFPNVRANSEARGLDHGVLKLSLRGDGYDWEFLPVAGKTFRDFGSAQCF